MTHTITCPHPPAAELPARGWHFQASCTYIGKESKHASCTYIGSCTYGQIVPTLAKSKRHRKLSELCNPLTIWKLILAASN